MKESMKIILDGNRTLVVEGKLKRAISKILGFKGVNGDNGDIELEEQTKLKTKLFLNGLHFWTKEEEDKAIELYKENQKENPNITNQKNCKKIAKQIGFNSTGPAVIARIAKLRREGRL